MRKYGEVLFSREHNGVLVCYLRDTGVPGVEILNQRSGRKARPGNSSEHVEILYTFRELSHLNRKKGI